METPERGPPAKFAEDEGKDYRIGLRNWPEMNQVEEHILELVAGTRVTRRVVHGKVKGITR